MKINLLFVLVVTAFLLAAKCEPTASTGDIVPANPALYQAWMHSQEEDAGIGQNPARYQEQHHVDADQREDNENNGRHDDSGHAINGQTKSRLIQCPIKDIETNIHDVRGRTQTS